MTRCRLLFLEFSRREVQNKKKKKTPAVHLDVELTRFPDLDTQKERERETIKLKKKKKDAKATEPQILRCVFSHE